MKTELNNIGTWGRLHYDFLYRNQRSVINAMRLKGTLNDYLMGIDKDAEDMFNLIVKQTAEIEGVTEQLKVADQMEWICRMNSIRSRAREFVLKELIISIIPKKGEGHSSLAFILAFILFLFCFPCRKFSLSFF